jgi:hypothetical protein
VDSWFGYQQHGFQAQQRGLFARLRRLRDDCSPLADLFTTVQIHARLITPLSGVLIAATGHAVLAVDQVRGFSAKALAALRSFPAHCARETPLVPPLGQSTVGLWAAEPAWCVKSAACGKGAALTFCAIRRATAADGDAPATVAIRPTLNGAVRLV